jgi:acyl-CoA thioester hydrolase
MMLEGTLTTGIHRLNVRVYYEDTDFSGYVYHANYLKFCERARSDFLRVLGVVQNAMFGDGGAFVVRRMTVETKPAEAVGARFELKQSVLRGDEMLFSADVTVVLIDGRGRPQRLTAELRAALQTALS